MSRSLPMMEFSGRVLINEYGDLTMGFQRYLRESLSSSAEECEADLNAYTKALKTLGPDYIVHIQDRYHKARVDGGFGEGEPKRSLSLSSDRHFHERPYLQHRSYLFITLTCGSRGRALFRRRLTPRETLDPKKVEDDCLLFVRILEENSDIRCRPLESNEYTGTAKKTGLCEQYALLQPPDGPPQTADIATGPDYRVGNKHVAVYTLCDADYLPAECSPYIRYDRYSTEKTLFPIGMGAWFGSLIDVEHVCNLYLIVVEPAGTLKKLETRRRRLHSLAGVDRENAVAEKDIVALQEEAAHGEQQLLRMHVNLIGWTEDKAELGSLQGKMVVAIGKTGATPHLETADAGRVALAGMPGNAGSLMMSETFLTFGPQAACFIIGESNGRSAGGPFGIRLGDRATGIPLARAMGQLEKEMYGRQLAEYAKEVKALQSVAADRICSQGGPGAFIRGRETAFFVSAGLGKQQAEGLTVLFVSPMAPLARALQGKKPGDVISFNGGTLTKEEVY